MATLALNNEPHAASMAAEPDRLDPVVLIVDDDIGIRRFLRTLLTRLTHAIVLDAATAPSAVRIALTIEHPIDVLISDVDLSGADGVQLASELSSIEPGMQVLLISGNEAHQRRLAPGWMFLQKPFAVSELLQWLRAAFPDSGKALPAIG